MKRKPSNVVTCLALVIGLLLVSLVIPVAPRAKAQSDLAFDATLELLGYSDRSYSGPYDVGYYYFSLPPEWEPVEGGYLDLNLNYVVGGTWSEIPALLEVRMNGELLETVQLDTFGDVDVQVPLSPDTLRASDSDYLNSLSMILQANADCEYPQRTLLTVKADSALHLVYQERPVPIDLVLYPKPLYHSYGFEPSQVRFILPPEPTEVELQAAMIVAARLGRLTFANLQFDVGTPEDVAQADTLDEHLILIGSPERMPLLQELDLPVALAERQMALYSEMPQSLSVGQAFSYTLYVENTSEVEQSLTVEDLLPPDARLVGCKEDCKETVPGTIQWQVGTLKAGETASTVVSVELADARPLERYQEHVASLLDQEGNLLNVDSLSAQVVEPLPEAGSITSPVDEGDLMFSLAGRGVAEGDGIVQEVISPWSAKRVVLTVTGLSDEALLRAARVLGSSSEFPGISGSYALVRAVEPPAESEDELAEDVVFASLGYEDRVLNIISANSIQYGFDLPGQWAVSEGAYLALHFAHGATLVDVLSTAEIDLNGTPIGSVLLDEGNAGETWVTIPFSRTPLRAGRNYLNVKLIGHVDRCTLLNDNQLWMTVYADSGLHLPYTSVDLSLDLGNYPQPFIDQRDLSEVVFSLPAEPTQPEIEGVLRLVGWLGNAARGTRYVPRVVLGEGQEEELWTGAHMIAVGRPTANTHIAAVNETLPQPFRSGTDEIRQQVDDIVYRLPAGADLGFVQELPNPQDEDYAMLVVTGTTDESVAWALAALVDDTMVKRLDGNLALVQSDEIRSTDTRTLSADRVVKLTQALAPELQSQPATPTVVSSPTPEVVAAATPTVASALAATPVQVGEGQAKPYQPRWLIPLLGLSVIVVIVGVVISIRRSRP